ncbi:MAG: ABC transporter permease, partial [Actinobacteria bacterium]|nr:ABC transporter permease [Actinomycetota bacterium]
VYYGPSMARVVLLVVVQMGARGLVAERENGTFARMLSLGVSPLRLLAAKALLSLLLGMGAMSSTLWLVGALTGARWGNVVLAAGVCLATVSAFAAVGAAITIVCPTEDAAAGLGLVAGIFLALLGGNFVPLSQAPELLQRLGVLTPNRWALGAFSRLGVDRAGVADLLPWVGGLVAYAAVFIAVAVVLGRRRVALG